MPTKSETVICKKCGTIMNFTLGNTAPVERTVPDCPRCRGSLKLEDHVGELEWQGWVEE